MSVSLRLFAAAREAAGASRLDFDLAVAPTVGALLHAAVAARGPSFEAVLATARVWVNGDEPADGDATPLADGDEIAVLPPVSGGS